MICLYLILGLVFVFSFKKLKNEHWNSEYISKYTTNVIKGVCIWIVFICHISSYLNRIPSLPYYDILLFVANGYVKQLLVVPFLFYSGYGVTLAIKNKGADYASTIPRVRCLSTLVNFDIAVLIFLIINLTLGNFFDIKQIVLSFLAIDSVGNSNWYIFCILICYLISWVSYKIMGINHKMIYAIVLLVIAYTLIMVKYSEGSWWYDSAYSYAGGAIFAWKRDKLLSFFRNNYVTVGIISIFGFVLCYYSPTFFGIMPNFSGLFLCIIIILLCNKIKLKNNFLHWSGKNLFPLYIYQRVPMLIFSSICDGLIMYNHPYIYILLCLVCTIIIALAYKYFSVNFKSISAKCPKLM